MKKMKKHKVLVVPGWMSGNQRSETESHSPRRRAKQDLFEDDVSSSEGHIGPSETKDTNTPRAGASTPKLNKDKLLARRALAKERQKTKKKPKRDKGSPAAEDLDKKTRWTPAPGKPFTVDANERKRLTKLLKRRTKDQKALKEKMGEAFMNAYKRYRCKITPSYSPVRSEMKLAEDAAVITFLREMTPGRVIAYWHEHIGDFTQLKAVPLRFLASPANIDQVALARAPGTRGTAESRPKGKSSGARVHAYGDARALDSRLRGTLEDCGYDVSQFSDRELMSIQNAARAKASGKRMFVSSKLSPLVKCAAEELYA